MIDVMLVPCASVAPADECELDKEDVYNYLGREWNLLAYHNQ